MSPCPQSQPREVGPAWRPQVLEQFLQAQPGDPRAGPDLHPLLCGADSLGSYKDRPDNPRLGGAHEQYWGAQGEAGPMHGPAPARDAVKATGHTTWAAPMLGSGPGTKWPPRGSRGPVLGWGSAEGGPSCSSGLFQPDGGACEAGGSWPQDVGPGWRVTGAGAGHREGPPAGELGFLGQDCARRVPASQGTRAGSGQLLDRGCPHPHMLGPSPARRRVWLLLGSCPPVSWAAPGRWQGTLTCIFTATTTEMSPFSSSWKTTSFFKVRLHNL